MSKSRALMIQGTASGVGKSVLTTLFCRLLLQKGYRAVPFKAQNLTSIYYDTPSGRMGRSQAIQALACGQEPHPCQNPLLMSPQPQGRVEVYLGGQPLGILTWEEYREKIFPRAVEKIRECWARLKREGDIVVIEGAGSPVEVNLASGDLANIFTARLVEPSVLLVGDISRGGVLASLVGTLTLMEERERARVAGLIINKFQGKVEIFREGLEFLEEKTGLPVLGVLPYLADLPLEDEDEAGCEGDLKSFPGMTAEDLGRELDIYLPAVEKALDMERILELLKK